MQAESENPGWMSTNSRAHSVCVQLRHLKTRTLSRSCSAIFEDMARSSAILPNGGPVLRGRSRALRYRESRAAIIVSFVSTSVVRCVKRIQYRLRLLLPLPRLDRASVRWEGNLVQIGTENGTVGAAGRALRCRKVLTPFVTSIESARKMRFGSRSSEFASRSD